MHRTHRPMPASAREAIDSYRAALAIHPHMDCLKEAIPELQARLRDGQEGN